MKREEILKVVQNNMQKVIPGAKDKPIMESHSMKDFGADSLQIVEVVSRSMRDLKLKVRRSDLATAKNLSQLIDLFEAGKGPDSGS